MVRETSEGNQRNKKDNEDYIGKKWVSDGGYKSGGRTVGEQRQLIAGLEKSTHKAVKSFSKSLVIFIRTRNRSH